MDGVRAIGGLQVTMVKAMLAILAGVLLSAVGSTFAGPFVDVRVQPFSNGKWQTNKFLTPNFS